MSSGFDALSLALFTTLAPAGIIAYVVMAMARLGADNAKLAVRIDRILVLPFACVLIGFIASATHLGTPANALHVFAGVGRSPLSNEVFAAVLFLFLAGSYWMTAFRSHFPSVIAIPWLIASSLTGLVLIACTAMAYSVETVPTWDSVFTPLNVVFGALLAGPVLGLLFLRIAQVHRRGFEVLLVVLTGIALVVGTVVLSLHQASLADISNNVSNAASLVPHYGTVIGAHAILGLAALAVALLSLPSARSAQAVLTLRTMAALLALAAVFITRIVFYNLHMTVGF